jgi:hypothetical protein
MIQRLMTPCYALIVLFFLSSQVYASYDDWSSRVKSCAGWDCSPNKYGNETICPQGSKGASGTSYICKNDKWVPVLVKSCAGWDCSVEGQLCPKGAEGALGQDFVCHRKKWVPAKFCDARKVGRTVRGLQTTKRTIGGKSQSNWDKISLTCRLSPLEVCIARIGSEKYCRSQGVTHDPGSRY